MENNSLLLAFTATTLAFLLNLYITPYLIYLSRKKNWFDDAEDERKIHTGQISRLGGIGIIGSLIISGFVTCLVTAQLMKSSIIFRLSEHHNAWFILAGALIIYIIGLLDDFTDLKARVKLAGQIIASVLVVIGGAQIRAFSIPFTEITLQLGWFGPALTMLWLIGMTNAINLIDGMDGLSAGISSMACFIYGIAFFVNGQPMLSIISFTLLGSIMGYLFYNFPPAKIFMGDSGSLSLGFILALLPLLGAPESGDSLIMPVVMLAIPITDVLAAMLRRKRKGQHFFEPDKEHMHHKLLDLDLDARQVLSLVVGLQILSGFAILIFGFVEGPLRYLPVLIALCLVASLFLYLHWDRHYKKK
ncbi:MULTISPECIES: MraY family glycosyltransferase [unclassified Oceanispirochaeta]|uniref:MraY family glycosyltransferase n=1 Tax=unclassified Oceanispirochaeta TaxID=2635722 RepID=UPI000E08F23C|nr:MULTISPECIES: MraY family glycosyltransferase [unclassified Oceanispirochaeta]MBF9016496.1 undecaprenyl/decaprenyl-phosphate alpha-N-acetylglucosaminyl 1-phosphate transferase [Oceanispirochaeta sp. M2]NPD72958.1 undecaprenyl/decaprenyl-phosphate alpha-N-acetylglucosaminyl 1-phosphate transferase [Oceanispirochaeta sp. M1]RDG31532.1 undecaprenyl/decaprenyl-phosphate alpha-N-acetylglucosaminyl 1-phosphate transferase [Oceanispirochaeta sp. M1]